ncbi:L-fucose:H+ symporter permease [Dysgonomonas sp. Marseille-P4677]|uniref:L-fucose:H+ symporter permease n=1 Tax=Dysgonomonas sp. Marseille-P4677 TaxID=2364790 RepID=UPI0019122F88|nr:L-fucose:H+ symporter permease [Dysgonomonas sp. Marseille-P4677]MBK5720623.1 L-fucose:H+ symporter permease [Dysgonomonas sp. Marseille-P4677]
MKNKEKKRSIFFNPEGGSYLFPFILISSLFLMWGFAHGLLDVLNKHFQEAFTMSKAESGLVQFSTYIAYGLIAFPAGIFMRKYGYKKGIILGLIVYAIGAFSFIPAAYGTSPEPFLVALFIVACGLCVLETAANPYSTVLGPKESASRRLNLSQSLNGLGWVLGPLIGGHLILGAEAGDATALTKPYILIGSCVLVITVIFFFVKLPDIKEVSENVADSAPTADILPQKSIWKHKHFVLAFIAQIMYMIAQTGIFALFINYVMELDSSISKVDASRYLAFGGMFLFMIGRLSGSFLMARFEANKLLAVYAITCAICMALVVMNIGFISLVALCICFFFMSIMFPTIYALGLAGMGTQTKKAASFLTMAVAGGAFSAIMMGAVGEENMAIGFIIPLICFVYISFFGLKGYKVR